MTKKTKEYPAGKPAGRPTHPGALLSDAVLPALRVTVSEAAKELGISRQTLHRILAETHPVTPDMAVRLGRWCGNGPGLWLRMQAAFDLYEAEQRLARVVKKIPVRQAA